MFNPDVRYVEDDELKYSLRSAELFLPWIRRVFLVTDNQVPEWLDRANPRVRVVDHTEFVSEPEWLPTFNSKAIAAQLHNIEELSEHFLCCNDDTFFGAPCQPEDFFAVLPDGRVTMKVMLSESDDDWIIPAHWIEHDPLARLWMAGWNNLKVTLEARRPWRKVRHLSIHQAEAMTRSALRDTAQKFASDYRRTCASRFRNKDDINFIALTNYRCLAAKTAVRGMLPHRVFARESDLDAYTRAELPTLFCVNGGPDETELTRERALQRLFPEPSSFERVRAPAARRETPPLASERAP
ncbi:MAG TPA: stealth conserved region 3 domain-containing protein [Longimicrobiaceae bacterium]|nr:stealth conserved region 3 domain-containing protein [Longimicrobiaceae bacterium]